MRYDTALLWSLCHPHLFMTLTELMMPLLAHCLDTVHTSEMQVNCHKLSAVILPDTHITTQQYCHELLNILMYPGHCGYQRLLMLKVRTRTLEVCVCHYSLVLQQVLEALATDEVNEF